MSGNVSAGGRIVYLDNLRAFCILGMIFCHSVIYGVAEDLGDIWYFVGNHVLGDWPAAIFLAISGFMLEYRQSATSKLLKRGIFLIAVGMALAVMNDGWDSFFECDVLTVIGISSLVYPLVRGRASWVVGAWIAVIVCATAGAHLLLDYHAQWGGRDAVVSYGGILIDPGDEYEAGALTLGVLAKAVFFNGYFPILPWLSFSLLGVLLAKQPWRASLLGTVGGLLIIAGGIGVAWIPWSFYPLSATFNLLLIGLVLAVFSLRGLLNFSSAPLGLLSRYSLTAYALQYVVLNIVAHTTGKFPEPWCGYALGVGVTLLVLLAVLVIDRTGGKVSLEMALKKVAG